MKSLVAIASLVLCVGGCDDSQLPPPQPSPTVSASSQPSAVSEPAPSAGRGGASDEPVRRSGKVYEHTVFSDVYQVDAIYRSMKGPHSTAELKLEDLKTPELLWVVGFEAQMVQADGDEVISQEFMCHANLDIDPSAHRALFGQDKLLTGRLFTLSQGQYRIDLPAGFGIPLLSNEVLALNTQVLNLNDTNPDGRRVRHKIVIRYMRDKDLKREPKALYVAGAYGLKLLEGGDGHHGLDHGGDKKAGQTDEHVACLPGVNASTNSFDDHKGRKFTGHWVVEPGREVNHTRVTKLMDLQRDTTLHYIAVHLPPFAESLELKDLTAGKTVYTATTRQAAKGIGLAHVDFFSDAAGVPLFADHEYEIISVYDNTSGQAQDSMAVMNLYLLDREFKKPSAPSNEHAQPTAPASAATADGKSM